MDTLDFTLKTKRPWRRDIFPRNVTMSKDEEQIYMKTYLTNVLDDYKFNLYFQSRQDVLFNYVFKYMELLRSVHKNILISTLESSSSSSSSLSSSSLSVESLTKSTYFDKITSYAQLASYVYLISIKLNEDFEIDFYYFLNQLNGFTIDEVEELFMEDFMLLKQSKKSLEYLPLLIESNPMLELSKDKDGNLIVDDEELESLSNNHNIRDIIDDIEVNIAYFKQHNQNQEIEMSEKSIQQTQKDMNMLDKSMRRVYGNFPSNSSNSSTSSAKNDLSGTNSSTSDVSTTNAVTTGMNTTTTTTTTMTDPMIIAQTIVSIEREAQLAIDQNIDLELDQLLQQLSAEQVKSCNETNTWSHDLKDKVVAYFEERKLNDDVGVGAMLISNVGQEMEISSLEFEAKLQQTMDKKAELDQLIGTKMQMLNNMYGHGSSVDAMVLWLREVTVEKVSTSEKVSNLLSSIYSSMITSYIQENRVRKVLRTKSFV